MSTATEPLLDAISALAEALPAAAISPLAERIGGTPPGAWTLLHRTTAETLAAPRYREQLQRLVVAWQTHAPDTPPQSVALALRAAAQTLQRHQRAQQLELVWTGPSGERPLRRTAQVLHSLIDEAERELLIVAFAVYNIPEIGQALLRAVRRGVALRLVIESAQESSGKLAYDSLAAFGAQVAAQAQIYRWPTDQRPADAEGRHGSLHAKCAVADRQTMLISSANLTHYALNLNIELGLLVRGGPLPQQIAEHIQHLIQHGILDEVSKGNHRDGDGVPG